MMIQRALSAVLPCCAALLCTATAVAQIRGVPPAYQPPPPPPRPPQAVPVTPPPVAHPAYAAQPLVDSGQDDDEPATPSTRPGGARAKGRGGPRKAVAEGARAKERAREFLEKRVAGDELEAAVERVTEELAWHETMHGVRARSASTGRPILWINSLGDLDGFA